MRRYESLEFREVQRLLQAVKESLAVLEGDLAFCEGLLEEAEKGPRSYLAVEDDFLSAVVP